MARMNKTEEADLDCAFVWEVMQVDTSMKKDPYLIPYAGKRLK